ncbi:MAG: murein transglycosylase A [Planktomarina sp.]
MTWRALCSAALISVLGTAMSADVTRTLLSFSDLKGWQADEHAAAFDTFLGTCGDISDIEWSQVCTIAKENPNPRLFFETFFQPVLMENEEPPLFTGYFEPELNGSLYRTGRFRYPIYGLPAEVTGNGKWLTRREIEQSQVLAGRGLELAWVDDPVAAFFLQIQGSGRVRLPNGKMIRLGYGGANGQPYRSIGKELVRMGEFDEHQVSASRITEWVKANPTRGRELMWHNSSYVFFRRVDQVPAEKGPLGAMNRSITKLRSIAVDPTIVKLGAPVWIEKGGPRPMNRLMVAQDTGSAINGAQRADIFFGTGRDAGIAAGLTKDPGRMVVLLPIRLAQDLVSGS